MSTQTVLVASPDPYSPNYCDEGMIWDEVTRGCIEDPALAKPGTPWWAWLLIAIAVAAVIGFVIWFIIWATSTDNPSAENSALSISGVEFKVLSPTSIGATWVAVGDPNDVVTMYVNPSGQGTMRFARDGTALGNYSRAGPVPGVTDSGVVPSLTVTGLKSSATYDAVLVVTNPNLPDISNANQHESGLHTAGHTDHGTKFTIQASGQNGQISYNLSPPEGIPPVVSYTLGTVDPNNSLFHHDNDGFICATTQGQSLTADTPCGDGSSVLYSGAPNLGVASVTGIASQSQLRIATKSSLSSAQLANARWGYNANGDNEWCLVGGSGCMNYDVESPNIVLVQPTTNGNGNGTTVVATTGTNGTTVVATTDTTFEPVNPPGNQAIFVSSLGSKWVNTEFMG